MGLFSREPDPTTRSDVVRAAPAPYNRLRAMTASASKIDLTTKAGAEKAKLTRASGQSWQDEAWIYYDAISEIKYAFTLVANVASRCRIYAGIVNDPARPPVPIADAIDVDSALQAAAQEELARLSTGFGGIPGLIRDAGLNLLITGECYLVNETGSPVNVLHPGQDAEETWDIRSVDEVVIDNSGRAVLRTRENQSATAGNTAANAKALPQNAFIGRIWRPHPRFSDEPDSSMRGLLELCSELLLLNRMFRGTARSRLNAGLLYLPDGLSASSGGDAVPVPEGTEEMFDADASADDPEADEDEFEESLIEAMTTPIEDESSAASVVPLMIRGPEDLGEKIKHISFERKFDEAMTQRSDRVLERILQGLDVPKDLVTGLANVKYANAEIIDETLYKAHVEPLMLLFCDAITIVFLRQAIRARKLPSVTEDDIQKIVCWYDPSEIVTRPDRSADADSGFDRYAISWSAWRRAHGFSDTDAPSPTELALRMLIEKGEMPEDFTQALFQVIAPELMEHVSRAAESNGPLGDAVPPEVSRLLDTGLSPEASAPEPEPEPEPEPDTPPASVTELRQRSAEETGTDR